MQPLMIVFYNLGLGGIQVKIVDIINFLAKDQPDIQIFLLLREKPGDFDLSSRIRNKNTRVSYYPDWLKIKIPFFFPVFVLYQTWRLKPRVILTFSNIYSVSAIWAKLLLFWRKIKVVVSERNYTSRAISHYKLAKFRHFSIKILYPFADEIICLSRAAKKDLMESYGLSAEKIRIVPNWTRLAEEKIIRANQDFDLIFVGRLVKAKNLLFLLKGVKEIKKFKRDINFCLVGEGEEEERLKNFTRENDLLDNVKFVGVKSRVGRFLARSKIFVLSSHYEGFPTVILEAMAMGVPVLTRNFAGAREVIKDGENGFIFDSMDEFVKKARWLLENQTERKIVASRAKKYVRIHHSLKKINDYLDLAGIKKRGREIKIGLVCSRGGHLLELFSLKDWWGKNNRFWVTGKGEDINYLLKKEKVYYGYFPEHRNFVNALRNFFLGLKVVAREKPDLLVSTGAGIAPPVFLAGKIFGCKLIFIDSYTFIKDPSLSARLVRPFVDKLLVQHRGAKKFIKKAEYWGGIV